MLEESSTPRILMIAGPNGAGKTTVTPRILKKAYDIVEWVNADVIAQGLSGLRPESAAWQAGRVMIERLRELADQRQNFAFETTLAGRSYFKWIDELRTTGYEFHLSRGVSAQEAITFPTTSFAGDIRLHCGISLSSTGRLPIAGLFTIIRERGEPSWSPQARIMILLLWRTKLFGTDSRRISDDCEAQVHG